MPNPIRYTPNARLNAWLAAGPGRAHYFSRIDPGLFPPLISKMKSGMAAITFEYAIRLERAQMPSDDPLKAEELMAFQEHIDLYRYVTGKDPAPEPKVVPKRAPHLSRDPRTPVA